MAPRKHRFFAPCLLLLWLITSPALAQVLSFDFQLDPGDQGQREATAGPATRRITLQVQVGQVPSFSTWSTLIRFDPAQLRFVQGSFVPGPLLPGQTPLLNEPQPGQLEIGGTHPDKVQVSGEGELGQLQFELLEGVSGPAELVADMLKLQDAEISVALAVGALAICRLPAPPTPAPALGLLSLAGAEAMAHLFEHRACPGCDLRRQNLAQTDLSLVDLHQAQLQEVNLIKADLHQADLRGANLKGGILLQADLRDAKLQGAELKEVRLGGAKLQGADLSGALMDTLDLQGVNVTGVIWVDGRICGSGSFNRCK